MTEVAGSFERGDPVAIHDPSGKLIARGLAEYSSAECEKLKGKRTDEHAELLGYAPRSAVVHRDQLVLL